MLVETTVRSLRHALRRALLVVVLAIQTLWLLAGAGAARAQRGAAAVAPTGQLRVALNVGNPVLAVKDPATGEVRGVTIDLSRALAAKLGVPVALVEYANVARIVDGARSGTWDIAFLAIDPARAGDMDFTPPYMEVEDTYLVPTGSPIRTTTDADRPGIRIAVPSRSAPDVFLSSRLTQASLVRGETEAAAFELLRAGHADAFAANRNSFATFTAGLDGYRALDDSFLAVPMAIAVPKGRAHALTMVRAFLEEAKAAGDVQRAIARCPPARRPGRGRSGGTVKLRQCKPSVTVLA
jgi:polar amino acid transport system substrate-binding protein